MTHKLLSQMKWEANYIFGNDVLTVNPELGALVSRTIAGWAITESHLGNAFAELIGAKQSAALSMYCALRSFEVQRSVLETFVREKLPKARAQVFCATVAVICKNASIRHHFAHWIWGSFKNTEQRGKTLLLVEPKHFWLLRTQRITHAKKSVKNPVGQFTLLNAPQLDPRNVQVWDRDALIEACSQMETSFARANALNGLVSEGAARRLQIQRQLEKIPEIHAQLLRMYSTDKKSLGSSP